MKNKRNHVATTPLSFLHTSSGKQHTGKTWEDHYSAIESPDSPVKKPVSLARSSRRKKGAFAIDPYYDSAEWKDLRFQTLLRDGHICHYCGGEAHQADHVIPRKKGGPDHLDNLVAACAVCNKTAGGLRFRSIAAKKKYVLKHRHKHLSAAPVLTVKGKGLCKKSQS